MQQLAALVVAHGFDVHIGSRCQAADRERVWTHSLTPYPGTEISMPGCKQLPLNLLFRPSLARASPPFARPSVASFHWYWCSWGSAALGSAPLRPWIPRGLGSVPPPYCPWRWSLGCFIGRLPVAVWWGVASRRPPTQGGVV